MLLLGYGGKTLQIGSVIYNKILNDRLSSLPQATEDQARSFLAQVAVIEAQINDAPARLAAKQIDGLTMNLQELEMLRKERRRIGRELANHLDIPYQAPGGPNLSVLS